MVPSLDLVVVRTGIPGNQSGDFLQNLTIPADGVSDFFKLLGKSIKAVKVVDPGPWVTGPWVTGPWVTGTVGDRDRGCRTRRYRSMARRSSTCSCRPAADLRASRAHPEYGASRSSSPR